MKKLWEYAEEYRDIDEDEDTPLEVKLEILDAIKQPLAQKLENCAAIVKNAEARHAAFHTEYARLRDAANREQALADGLKGYMLKCMQIAGLDRVEISRVARYVAVQKNPARLVTPDGRDEFTAQDLDALPQGYVRTIREPEKSALKKAIANGESPPGCRLQTEEERGDSLRIR